MKRLASIVALGCLVVSSGAVSCIGRGRAPDPTLPPLEDAAGPATPSSKIVVDWYLDSSIPMKGFLETPPGASDASPVNFFREMLLHASAALTWSGGAEVHHWRFGRGEPRPVASLSDFAARPQLFSDGASQIDQAVKAEGSEAKGRPRIKIVITDLMMTGDSIVQLGNELAGKYLRTETDAVAILGIRNPFHGEIDDLPGRVPRGGADSLPFYVLLGGPLADVRHAIAGIERIALNGTVPAQFLKVLFSRRPVERLEQPLEVKAADANSLFVSRSDIPGAASRAVPIRQIGLDYRRPVRLVLSVASPQGASPLPGLEVTQQMGMAVELNPTVRRSAQVWSALRTPGAAVDAATLEAFDFGLATSTLSIDPARLERDATYLLRLDAAGEPGDFADLEAWSLEDPSRVVQNQAFDRAPDGGRPAKTPNLRRFLRTLSASLTDVPLARFYLYVSVN